MTMVIQELPAITDAIQRALHEYQRGNAVERNMSRALAGTGLSFLQALTLQVIADGTGSTRGTDIATELGISSQSITPLIDRLERTGLVTRTHGTADRRAVYLDLTPEGHLQMTVTKAILEHVATEYYREALN